MHQCMNDCIEQCVRKEMNECTTLQLMHFARLISLDAVADV